MGKTFIALSLMLLASGNVHCEAKKTSDTARIRLLPNSWSVVDKAMPVSVLGQSKTSEKLHVADDINNGFTICFTADFSDPTKDRKILEIPEVLEVRLRPHNPLDRDRQNYPAYHMPDGSVPVLEAVLHLVSPLDGSVALMPIGIPLAILDKPFGKHEITLNFSGVRWTMYVDGHLLDNDFPFGYPDAGKMQSWNIDPEFISHAGIVFPASEFRRVTTAAGGNAPLQYWSPAGHNSWVGDVVSIYYDNSYHLFYLYDRRGHQSKLGRGGHYFEHLSTKDFIHWTEHEAAVPIEEQWETFGTGTPFVAEGKLCISYGYHTTRLYPREQTTLPKMFECLEHDGQTTTFNRHELDGIAAGSSYSVSDDGVNFKKTGLLFHPCENPSIYVDPNGELRMLANYGARGTWTADSVNGNWHCLNKDFPPGGDCTFFFNWGEYDYIIGGFSNLWSKKSAEADSTYHDLVASGEDFYNGLCVPTISKTPDGRYIMAGWMWLKAWGGVLAIHELIQFPDGRIGTKWMEELLPATSGKSVNITSKNGVITTVPDSSFLLTFDVVPDSDSDIRSIALSILPETDKGVQDGCEWSIYDRDSRAQYNGINRESREKTLCEGGEPHRGGNYAIGNLINTDKPFKVRMVVKYSQKYDGSIIDTEIAGSRTMLTYREKLKTGRIQFQANGMTVSNVRLTPLAE